MEGRGRADEVLAGASEAASNLDFVVHDRGVVLRKEERHRSRDRPTGVRAAARRLILEVYGDE